MLAFIKKFDLFIFVFFLLCIPFYPSFNVIDVIGSQWFFISLFNLALFIYIFNNYQFVFNYLNNKFSIAYLIFLFFCLISFFWSINPVESLIVFVRILSTATTIFLLSQLVHKYSLIEFFKYLSVLISLFLFIDLLFSLSPFFNYLNTKYYYNSLDFLHESFMGLYPNKNITSFLIIIKLPFVLYLTKFFNNWFKIILYVLVFLALLSISFLSTRSVFLSSLLVILFQILSNFRNIPRLVFNVVFFVFILFTIFKFNQYFSASDVSNLNSRINSIELTEDSSNFRFYLWDNALDYIADNPFIGCGIGNWKIESLSYWKFKLSGYMVPYHAHNDFLEITAEIGLIGGLIYLSIFIFFLITLLRLFRYNSVIVFLLLSVIACYFIDAFFNFPLERATSQVFFVLMFISFISVKNFLSNEV